MTVGPRAVASAVAELLPRRPWLKFYPSDWQGDERLTMCSLGARGLLVEVMAIAHRAEPYGYLLVGGRPPSDAEFARLARCSVVELRRLRDELLRHGVLSRTADGILFSRRMVRDAARSANGHLHGKRGGNPQLKVIASPGEPLTFVGAGGISKGLTPVDNTHIPEARGQNPQPPAGAVEDPAVDAIAGEFLERYPEVYARCRAGATYRVSRMKQERDLAYARELVRAWPNVDRLLAMAEIFLRRNDLGDKANPGTPGQFLHMAPDCDRLLREHGR